MTNNDIAWLAGLAVTAIPTIIYYILLMTEDYGPIERRARRFAILASFIVFMAIWSVTASIYSFVSELAGIFLMFPSIGLSAVAVWHVSRLTYRKMGGGKESQSSSSEGATVRS
ncbi:hypothetical protein [Thiobacillus denitrificans]|uniref:hypothetical protein n=1 Tax=Thiobacillus denitrificans TaxID=36861 RepID=UPI00038115C6|nr:hypothetical protein [Thiobacillus denitrificans]